MSPANTAINTPAEDLAAAGTAGRAAAAGGTVGAGAGGTGVEEATGVPLRLMIMV